MRKGWFRIPGVQDGDRSLDDQLKGLGPMLSEAAGNTVLDLGCAEGLISQACLAAGAARVYGMDVNPDFVDRAAALQLNPHFCRFMVTDLNNPPDRDDLACCWSDIVLMLAVLHKLKDPARSLRAWSQFAMSLLVIRLPAATPGFVCDPRSGNRRIELADVLSESWTLERVEKGHFDEWTGYYRKVS